MKSEQDSEKTSRRHHDRAFKQELVRQSLEPGASVSAIALRSGVNANMLFKWRREHLRGTGPRTAAAAVLLPMEVAPAAEFMTIPASAAPTPPPSRSAPRNGVIELEFVGAQLRLRGAVSSDFHIAGIVKFTNP